MKYSFVIPCYRSEHTLEQVVGELIAETKKQHLTDYEIVLVNDCSPDDVWHVIQRLSREHACVYGINLARNFGQHAALLAGYAKTKGDIIVSLDDDGQAPVDELDKLLGELERGQDVVYAYYEEIKQNRFRKFGTAVATWMSRIMLGAPEDFKGSSFYVAKRFVIEEMLRYKNAYPYLLGLVLRTTRKIGYVQTSHRERVYGTSGYSFLKLFSLWLNGFTAFSVKPLEIGVWLGILFAAIGFIGGLATVIHKIIRPSVMAGWSSTVCLILLMGGVIMLMLGVIGEYIGRIYICINNAPQYVVKEETPAKKERNGEKNENH